MYCHQTNCHKAAEKKCRDCPEYFCRTHLTDVTVRRDKASDYVCPPCLVMRNKSSEEPIV